MSNAIFVPANGRQFEGYWKKLPDYKHALIWDLRHFTDQSMVKHNWLLTNAYYNIEDNNENFRDVFRVPDSIKVIGDSGGFQIASFARNNKPIKINPFKILSWMENNVDIGMNIDIPPWFIKFSESIRKSIENFKIFEDNRTNYNFKLYNILHGTNLNEIETWYSAVKNFNFDGWAIGIKPSYNVFLQVLGYLVLHEKGALNLENGCHFFGMSSVQNMISLAMLSNYFNTDITFDSSSFNMGSRIRAYYLPLSIRNFMIFGRDSTQLMEKLPCNCPVCSNSSITEFYEQKSWQTPLLLSLHNLYQFTEVNKMINIMAKDPEMLLEYSKTVGEERLVTTLASVLRDYSQKGYQKIYEIYKLNNVFMEKENEVRKRSLEGFK